ncbi:MAG: amino acid ABC transporter substrate-binding protein [Pseudomonadota bacterium]
MSARTLFAVATTLLIAGLLLAQHAAAAPRAEPLRIGATVSRTGALAPESQLVEHGLKLWAEDLNDRGALLDRPVQLVLRDDASDPQIAAQHYRSMLDAGISLFVSPYSSDLTLAVRDALGARNFAMITIASAPGIWDQRPTRLFGLYAPADDNMRPALELAAERGLERVAIAALQSRFPLAVARGAANIAAELGLEVVAQVEYPEAADLTPIVRQLKAARADAVLVGGYMEDAQVFTRAASAVGLTPKLIVFSGAPAIREFGTALGYDTVDGVLSTVQWMRSVRFPGAFDFGFRYRRHHGIYPSYDAAGGYAALQVLEAAIRLAGTTAPAAVRTELSTLKFRSILGHFRVDATGRQIAKRTYLVQWQGNHISLVHPPEIARWDLRFPFPGW